MGGEDIYVASGTKSNSAGTATYDASADKLTLNNYNGTAIKTSGTPSSSFSLIANGTNTIDAESGYGIQINGKGDFSGSGTININNGTTCIVVGTSALTFSDATFSNTTFNLNCSQEGIHSSTTHVLSGNFNYTHTSTGSGNGLFYSYNSITIDSGTFKSNRGIAHTIMHGADIVINNGQYEATSDIVAPLLSSWGGITINNGTISSSGAYVITQYGSSNNDIVINGGTINIANIATPIETYTGNISITGGHINLNATYHGISQLSSGAHGVSFTGGYTKITTSGIGGTISVHGDNGIAIGDGMKILEDDVYIGQSSGYYRALTSNGSSFAKVTTICPTSSSECTAADSSSSGDNDFTLTSASGGKDITNPDTSDHFWIYAVITAGVTITFVALRKYYDKH